VLVRAAVERYPDWWDTATVGPPYQEAELYPLGLLHDLVDQLRLARRQHGGLQLTPKGRALRADPQRLLSELAATLAPQLPAESDPALARLVLDDQPDEIDWSLYGLLAPFNGIIVDERTPTAVTAGGRSLAAAILNARAPTAPEPASANGARLVSERDPNKEILQPHARCRVGLRHGV
jgi:hypothetical protein